MSRQGQLVNYREQLGLTQKQVADQLRVHVQCISNWERGVSSVPSSRLGQLSRILGIQPADLEYLRFQRLLQRKFGTRQSEYIARAYREMGGTQ